LSTNQNEPHEIDKAVSKITLDLFPTTASSNALHPQAKVQELIKRQEKRRPTVIFRRALESLTNTA